MKGDVIGFFNRDGVSIDKDEFVRLRADPAYAIVGRTQVTDAEDSAALFNVDTTWLGVEFENEPVRLFATSFIDDGSLYYHPFATLADARRGHTLTVKSVASTLKEPIIVDTTPPENKRREKR